MHLTYAKMGITQEDSRFDFVRRCKDDGDDFSSQLLIDISIKKKKKKKT